MQHKANYKPDGYHTATPYLIVNDAARAIEFYKKAFGAAEMMRISAPGGKVGHAEIQIGDSRIMLADEAPQCDARSPQSIGGTPVSLMLYLEDVDAVVARAVSLGAKVLMPIKDQFYGAQRHHRRSVRPPVAHCHAHGRCPARRTGEAGRRAVWEQVM